MLLKPILPVVEYAMNYEYISKVLCVNKAKPMMHCNGKCHLMKELAKASENEKPISSDKKNSVQEFEVLFFQKMRNYSFSEHSFIFRPKLNYKYSNLYTFLSANSVFHPPTSLS